MVACVPALVFVGSAAAYFGFTESGDDDPVPRVRRGDSIDEPWWGFEHVREHVLPGSTVLVLPRDKAIRHDTRQDRKSTRLNSSHLVISYAVFCLKKKRQTETS